MWTLFILLLKLQGRTFISKIIKSEVLNFLPQSSAFILTLNTLNLYVFQNLIGISFYSLVSNNLNEIPKRYPSWFSIYNHITILTCENLWVLFWWFSIIKNKYSKLISFLKLLWINCNSSSYLRALERIKCKISIFLPKSFVFLNISVTGHPGKGDISTTENGRRYH